AGDVGRDLDLVGQADTRHLAQRRVRLLRRLREHAHAHAALLRTVLQRRTLGLDVDLLATLANELADRRHSDSTCTRRRYASTRRSGAAPMRRPTMLSTATSRSPRRHGPRDRLAIWHP